MATTPTARPMAARAFMSACAAAVLAGCLGDPSPNPETAPLEVVLDGCVLNRTEVAAGSHEVALIGTGRLIVTDQAGKQVLSLPNGAAQLLTSAQSYTFTCTVGTDRTSTTLKSVPASP